MVRSLPERRGEYFRLMMLRGRKTAKVLLRHFFRENH